MRVSEADRIMMAARRNRATSISDVLGLVEQELHRAYHKFPTPQSSLHEGYAVLLEEVDELWDDIKADKNGDALIEALQVAAMAVRLIVDSGGQQAVDLLMTRNSIKKMGG
jgi:hypothetical protein